MVISILTLSKQSPVPSTHIGRLSIASNNPSSKEIQYLWLLWAFALTFISHTQTCIHVIKTFLNSTYKASLMGYVERLRHKDYKFMAACAKEWVQGQSDAQSEMNKAVSKLKRNIKRCSPMAECLSSSPMFLPSTYSQPTNKTKKGAGNTAQQLRILNSLVKEPGSMLSTHTVAHNHLYFHIQGI